MPAANGEQSIFLAALELKSSAERAAYLKGACGDDEVLLANVQGLLASHDQGDNFLDNPPLAGPATSDEHPMTERPGTIIGPYKLMEQIGEGGMGVVFVAEQQLPMRRKVALKLIKPGMDTRDVIARFEAERQALALMDHPNIAKVLDAGATESGRPYFVMELVKGIPITDYCDHNELTPGARLELFVSVCQAVQHAHTKGIIHRDLKPSNILIAPHDGTPVVKVIDFGVAKAVGQPLTDKTIYTRLTQMIGTPLYMSPEQAEINALDVDTRSDVYALAVLLYELLTGTTPFDRQRFGAAAFDEIRRIIREEEPPRPSMRLTTLGDAMPSVSAKRKSELGQLSALVRGDLDWIVMKGLEKDRARRYETASALAADVRRYLSEEPVEARPPSAGYRLRKFVRRHRGPVVAAAAVLLTVLAGIAGTTWGWVEAVTQRDDAVQARTEEAEQRQLALKKEAEARQLAQEALFEKVQADLMRRKAEANETKAEWRLYASHIASAQREWETHNTTLFYHYLDQCRPDFRGWEHDFLYTLAHQNQQTLRGHTDGQRFQDSDWTFSVAFSPDGKRLAASGVRRNGVVVVVWDAASGQEVLTLKGHKGRIYSVAFSPDGKRLASASWDNTVKVWDAVSGKEVRTIQELLIVSPPNKGFFSEALGSVAFSPDGKRLAIASPRFYQTGLKRGEFVGGVVKVWDAATGEEVLTLKWKGDNFRNLVRSVAFSPDGKYLAGAGGGTGAGGGEVRLWDAANGQEVLSIKDTGQVNSVAFSPDGKYLATVGGLASAGSDKTVKLWDTTSGQEVQTFKGHTNGVRSVAFSPDGKRLTTASADKTVKLWDVASGQEILTLKGHTDIVTSVAFSPDGTRLATASLDHTVKLWDVAGPQGALTLKGRVMALNLNPSKHLMAFSPDGKHLARSDADGSLKLCDAANGKEVLTFIKEPTPKEVKGGRLERGVDCLAFSPDGKRLAGATGGVSDGGGFGGGLFMVRVWDTASGQEILTFKGHASAVSSVAFSPDGKRLATATQGGGGERGEEFGGDTQKLWDASTGQEVLTLKGETGHISSVAFSPDGKYLAGASTHGAVTLWDAASGQVILTLKGQTEGVQSVAFSPDGKRLASASLDKTVKVWDAATGAEVLTLKGHTGQVNSVAFSPDGKRLASASEDNTVKVWDAASGLEVLTLRGHTGVDQFGHVVGVHSVAFSPDGKRLASTSADGTIKIWDASKSIKELGQK